MKLEKILTALIACACAMTAVTVSAFATSDDSGSDAGTSADGSVSDSSDSDNSDLVDDEKPAYVYTWQVPASENADSGWVSQNITQTDLIGTIKPADIDAIVIKGADADDEIGAGFNTTLSGTKAEGYYQTNDDDENWPSNTVTIKGSAVDWDNYYFQLFSNRGEATTVTVSVYTSADDNSDSNSTPSDSESESNTSSDSVSDSNSGGLVSDSNTSNSGSNTNKNPGTGVAMTFVPAIIAGAVVIAAKKRK